MTWKWRALREDVGFAEFIRTLNVRMGELSSWCKATEADASGMKTFADGDTTPSVVGAHVWQASNTAATNITGFDGGTAGDSKIVWATTANTTFVHSASLRMKSGANVTMSATDVREFATVDGVAWREI